MKLLVLISFLVCASAGYIPGHKNNKPSLHFPNPYLSAGVPAPLDKNLKTVYAELDRSAKTPADTILFELKENFDIPTGYLRYPAPNFAKDHHFLSPPNHGPIAELPAIVPAPPVAVIPAVAAPVAAVPAAPVNKPKCPCKDQETENSKEDAETDDSNDDARRQSRQGNEHRGGVEQESPDLICPCLLGNSGGPF